MKTKKAAAVTAAGINKLHGISYRRDIPMSRLNLKESIGILLFYLQTPLGRNERRKGWGLFDDMLRQHLGRMS